MTEEYNEEEKKYFETGEASDKLVEELKTPAPEVEPRETVEAPKPETPAPVEAAKDDDADDADEPKDEPAKPGEPQQRERRRFSRKEFESERAARLAAEKQFNDQRVEYAKAAERLALLQQALQEPVQPEAAPQVPDPEQDIFGYVRHLEQQLNGVTSEIKGYKEQIETGQREMDNERRYFESLNTYAGTKQDFVHAYNYLLRSRAAELTARSYQLTDEQLQGLMDGRVRVPTEIANELRQEERALYRTAFERGADPAQVIYQYATMRGYHAPAANPPAAPAAPAAGTPGTPLGGTPAAPRAPAQGGVPTATDIVNQIQKGQPASASLSKAGGVVPDTELTPEALANMSDDKFEALFNELSQSKNKEKLRNLMGN